MARDFSPEERLLKLIRSKAPKSGERDARNDSKKAEAQAEALKSPMVSSGVTISAPQPIRARHGLSPTPAKVFSIESLNLILTVLIAGLALYFIPLFFSKPKDPLLDFEEKIKTAQKTTEKREQGPQAQPFNYFSQEIGSRDIFQPLVKEEQPPQAAAEQGPKLEDIKGQLNLLGVITGERPQAIIEDKRSQKTYFLNKGEKFGDNIEVRDILENKVILFFKDQQFELVL